MRVLSKEKLLELQRKPDTIRNMCIIAHVDHGKTTLADSLVASNGIISTRMVGKLRYMDSRKDEQERGITMKSSSITLYYQTGGAECLVNVIDSPGHVDFSSEVSTALRLCDGAVVVVDVVEGVCPQTQVALKQAWHENIKPVLILNKIDRLILEMKLSPLDAFVHLTQVLEQVNAVTGELFMTEVLGKAVKDEAKDTSKEENTGQFQNYDWGDGLDEADDSTLYFSPNQGNVVFASALDGWGFGVNDFVKLYSKKLGLKEDVLKKTLWGDYYLNNKTKRVMRGAQEKAKKPLFVQLVLENIWTIYETICIRKDKTKIESISSALGVKLTQRDLRHTDPKVQLQAIFSQWLPLSNAVLDMVYNVLPPANKLSEEKVEKLMCSSGQSIDLYPPETQALKKAFINCSSSEDEPVIVFVSKMFPVDRKVLPRNRPTAITEQELAARRDQARLRHAELMANKKDNDEKEKTGREAEVSIVNEEPILPDDEFIAFARVYSGVLKKGAVLYVLGPKHNPATALQQLAEEGDIPENLTLKDLKSGHHATKVKINDIYLMMGRELETIDEAPAGNVVGIGGLEDHILKSATLSSVIYCPSFSELNIMAVPILRIAVEPKKHSDLPALIKGLKLLNQADACVQVFVQETGEHVLVTAGEVHLERCIDDLKTRYAKIDINVSEPIIPFRETIVLPPTVDMVNEAIQESSVMQKKIDDDNVDENGVVTIMTVNKQSTLKIFCTPLESEVTEFLEKNSNLIKILDKNTSTKSNETNLQENLANLTIEDGSINKQVPNLSKKVLNDISTFKQELCDKLKKGSGIWSDNRIFDKIWSFGPRRCGPNLLINLVEGYDRSFWKQSNLQTPNNLSEYDSSFINGFQLASLAGPLCEEPMMGVAFIVVDWVVNPEIPTGGTYGPLSGQIMSAVKEGCRRSFQAQPQRLMAAMYTCNIQANAEVLGKMYAVLGRRHGRVLAGDMTQGSASFTVTAVLPVIESFSFAQEIRKQTSGLASPQLVFSHWEVIDIDPFWSPSTEEEYLHYGEKADTENKARQYMNSVRRRKGLSVEEKIVQHAEKQRTLSKKK
ncbi:elongation factor-like GTPase 1 [Cimex lectularius]|uniref:Ribosome assembly protein 1 n=1 Tax=Cimex lectularius TaxID=79782 RepID=A0A8I6RTV9_CIMLE|nr:elongation factor-like GTPase 1 [Cimex lectularius]